MQTWQHTIRLHDLLSYNIYMIILASGSWLREQILDKSEFEFCVKQNNFKEKEFQSTIKHLPTKQQCLILAMKKTENIKLSKGDIIIGADTVAFMKDTKKIFHKPTSHEQAIKFCMKQSGKNIIIITGFYIKTFDEQVFSGYSTSEISYVKFTEKTIQKLLINDEFTIRNAALGFYSDSPGFTLVKSIKGSYTGAMGLPMEKIRPIIEKIIKS